MGGDLPANERARGVQGRASIAGWRGGRRQRLVTAGSAVRAAYTSLDTDYRPRLAGGSGGTRCEWGVGYPPGARERAFLARRLLVGIRVSGGRDWQRGDRRPCGRRSRRPDGLRPDRHASARRYPRSQDRPREHAAFRRDPRLACRQSDRRTERSHYPRHLRPRADGESELDHLHRHVGRQRIRSATSRLYNARIGRRCHGALAEEREGAPLATHARLPTTSVIAPRAYRAQSKRNRSSATARAMISRWIWLVPSTMVSCRASR